MEKINGELLSKDKVVATVKDSLVTITNKNLAPIYFTNGNDKYIDKWLTHRAIDEHRTNSRLLKKALRLQNKDDISVVLFVNAATITDTYWFRQEGKNLTWDDIRFKENYFDQLALKGSFEGFEQNPSSTPEATNIGSFEKCWKQEDDKWWLYKTGTEKEYFSELFAYKLGQKLGFDMAYYEMDNKYIRTLDFTNSGQYNLEHMSSFVGDNEMYDDSFKILKELSNDLAKDYLKIIYLDTLCYNVDRHTENYGVLTDPNTGRIVKMAPNYDNNISLLARGYIKDPSLKNSYFVKMFTKLLDENKDAAKLFSEIKMPIITKEMISECINEIPIKISEQDINYINTIVLNAQDIVLEAAEKANVTVDKIIENAEKDLRNDNAIKNRYKNNEKNDR